MADTLQLSEIQRLECSDIDKCPGAICVSLAITPRFLTRMTSTLVGTFCMLYLLILVDLDLWQLSAGDLSVGHVTSSKITNTFLSITFYS